MTANSLYYFAYGSNLLPSRLLERVPSSNPLGCAQLHGHRLAWHKQGGDRSGKCDVRATNNPADVVWGAVYSLDPGEKFRLDDAEALGVGYDLRHVSLAVRSAKRASPFDVFYYQAIADTLNPEAKPFDWYHALVLAGARWHGFPDIYCSHIAAQPTVPDPDPERDQHHRALLEPNN